MPNDILLHPSSHQSLSLYTATPSGSIVISGLEGSGKEFAAQAVALQILGLPDRTKLAHYPYWQSVAPEGTSISIESIRNLQNGLKLSLPKGSKRVIAIIDAHLMTPESQNALLKTLEEPPADTYLILTTDKLEALLPTIRSRLQAITLQPPTTQAIQAYFKEQGVEVQSQHLAIARGRIGLLHAITEQTEHPMLEAIQTAKQIVSATPFERLALTDKLLKQKDQLQSILDGMAIIYRTLIAANAKAGKATVASQCAQKLARVLDTQDQLRRSVQAKLALDTLFLHI